MLPNHNTLLPIEQEAADPIDYSRTEDTHDQLDSKREVTNAVEGFGEVEEHYEDMKSVINTITNAIHSR